MINKETKGRVAISTAIKPGEFAQRILLAMPIGYFFSMEVAALLGRLLSFLIELSEAAVFSAMVSFLIYMFVILWVFADQKLYRLWMILPVVTVLCYSISTVTFVGGG
tara:strand:+ start:112 stop:435 length:324 start_codon:yes stop_codon:yes gene_type:complete